jgi:hypothetical protein
MNFLWEEKENTQNEDCLPSHVAHMCAIWGHLNKICHDFGLDLAHFAWKSWNAILGSSFLRRVFSNICDSQSLLTLLTTRSHNMIQCEGFTFFDFFWISYARFKLWSKRWAWSFLARSWFLQKYYWIYDEILLKKLWCTCSSN